LRASPWQRLPTTATTTIIVTTTTDILTREPVAPVEGRRRVSLTARWKHQPAHVLLMRNDERARSYDRFEGLDAQHTARPDSIHRKPLGHVMRARGATVQAMADLSLRHWEMRLLGGAFA
jgi:hypothetical protein